jgi:hypothetical protein
MLETAHQRGVEITAEFPEKMKRETAIRGDMDALP